MRNVTSVIFSRAAPIEFNQQRLVLQQPLSWWQQYVILLYMRRLDHGPVSCVLCVIEHSEKPNNPNLASTLMILPSISTGINPTNSYRVKPK
jgi:hypothetical protein